MNPAFVIIAIIAIIALWFLVSGLYRPLGTLLHKIGKDAVDAMNEEDKNKEQKDE